MSLAPLQFLSLVRTPPPLVIPPSLPSRRPPLARSFFKGTTTPSVWREVCVTRRVHCVVPPDLYHSTVLTKSALSRGSFAPGEIRNLFSIVFNPAPPVRTKRIARKR